MLDGDQFRRVEVTDGIRGGLLGQGSILTATSQPNRTSPVLRGKWILETILGGTRRRPRRQTFPLYPKPVKDTRYSRCASACPNTARTRPARAATFAWTRSASRSKTSTLQEDGEPSRRTAPGASDASFYRRRRGVPGRYQV